MVQLGDLLALATWKDQGEILVIRFPTAPLSRDQLQRLKNLRLTPHPVSLSLGRQRATSGHHIMGYEDQPDATTFRVSRRKD